MMERKRLSQIKAERIHHQKICLTRYPKGSSSVRKTRALTFNKKTFEGIKPTSKSKYTDKFRTF